MRKGKKITMALMALLSTGMLFSAVACGGNGDSASSSSGGTNSSTDSSSGNSQSSSSIDAERLDKIPDSELKTESAVGGTTATASWFAVYGENAMEFTVYVEDATIYTQGGLYNNDGVELLLTKVQRVKGYSEHTISVVVDATGDFQVKNLSTNAQVTDSGVTAKATAFTLTGTAVDGYYLNISVPYAAIEATKEKKDAAVCLGITNAKNAVDLKTVYDTTYHTDYKNIHTFMAITADNTYAANPYVQYGMVWGDGGSLKASSVWNIENDDGTENAHISMTGVDNLDNYIYMHGSNKTTFYGEAKINVKELLNGEKWGKFGLIMTSADGQDGFLFYVDAASADGKAFNENSVSLGFNTRTDGKWDGNWSNIGTLGGTSAQYTGSGYITLGIYRQGGVYKLYANDQLVKMVSCGIGTDEEAYLGLASFNITMDVKEYSLETDPSKLDEYKIVTEAKDYLFLGDSYIDTAFWYTYDNVFGTLSAANEGVGGTKTSYWMSMVETIKQMYDPKNIVIHIGVNDIDDGNTTGETTIGRLDALIDAYQTAFPETNIYYVGLVHNMMFQNKWAEYDKVNAHMKALAQDDPKLNFIDMAQYITANEKGSTMSWFNADGLHYGVDGYAEVKISVAGLTAPDDFAKAGLAVRTTEGTWFWALDANKNDNKEKYINGWSQVYNRMDTIKRDWDWGGCFGAFQWTYNNQYPDKYANGVSYDYKTDGSFKTMAIAKVGADLWFIADGKVVNCLIGVMGADTKAAVSVFNFNMEMYAKDGLVITDAAALKTKLDSMKIYETTKTVDGDISDWTDAQKANPYVIPATDGRSVTIYATMESDGIYVFYDVIHNSYITDKPEWFNNTNLELKFKDNLQRFADAAGLNSRWEFSARQINASKFISTTENGKHHTKAELFISYSCIDGLDKSDLQTFMGFAWGGGDFWYGAEADPGMPNIIVTKNGIRTGSIKTIDGDISDWKDETFTAANVKAGVTATYSAFLGNDGLYFAMEVKEASIDVTGTNTAGDWWKNTNLEFFANENSNTRAARVMTFGGNLYHTGYITDAAMNYADGETEDTWTIEVFIANEHLINVTSETASMKLDMGGQLYGAVTDTWQDYVRNTVINRKA